MKSDAVIIDFMLQKIARVRQFTEGNRELFLNSALVQSAALREMHLLTDVSKRLSDTAKHGMKEIAWHEIAGFRNYLVHEYHGDIDLEIVWQAIENDIGRLEMALKRYRETL